MIRKSERLLLFLIVLFMAGDCGAQQFSAIAQLDPVPATGFYSIPISPELSGYAKTDFSDVRISAGDSVFVPYIRQDEKAEVTPGHFTEYTLLSNRTEGRHSVIELESPDKKGLSEISFVLANTAVERFTSLSGSDDGTQWFIINDSIPFHRSYNNETGNYIQTISFPLVKYHYLRLKISNDKSDPLKVLRAGMFAMPTVPVAALQSIENPRPLFMQRDSSNKMTYVVISNHAPYLTDRVGLSVSGPRFYRRSAVAYIMQDTGDSSGLYVPVARFVLSSDSACYFTFTDRKAAVILVAISNEDDQPLRITGVTTWQQHQYLVSWLEKGRSYHILAGNLRAGPPVYDLSKFSSAIPKELPSLSYGKFSDGNVQPIPVAHKQVNYWLWPAIAVAVIVLSVLTYTLMKDVRKADQ